MIARLFDSGDERSDLGAARNAGFLLGDLGLFNIVALLKRLFTRLTQWPQDNPSSARITVFDIVDSLVGVAE